MSPRRPRRRPTTCCEYFLACCPPLPILQVSRGSTGPVAVCVCSRLCARACTGSTLAVCVFLTASLLGVRAESWVGLATWLWTLPGALPQRPKPLRPLSPVSPENTPPSPPRSSGRATRMTSTRSTASTGACTPASSGSRGASRSSTRSSGSSRRALRSTRLLVGRFFRNIEKSKRPTPTTARRSTAASTCTASWPTSRGSSPSTTSASCRRGLSPRPRGRRPQSTSQASSPQLADCSGWWGSWGQGGAKDKKTEIYLTQ